ncbi:hypothetical protein SAMN04488505_11020 [Chitinophaga rupis]|uniref:Uncharacterized protein n=1 Tax=Chitinophaga rupis TaxID=573321 RepID=A0A1H8G538_9BACT|nr:hypothetical protein [Chitinophaga rupis]SEN38418.1 hypothetical protein SAMN04488505_11020 [Chitinophaga rupis]
MFSFFKRKKTALPVPAWAAYFNSAEYTEFLSLLDNYFKNKGIAYVLGDGEIILDNATFGAERMGLVNVSQVCKQHPQSAWKSCIEDHFNGMERAFAFTDDFEKRCHDLSFARDYIGIRLYHNSYVENIDPGLIIGKPLAGDLFMMLVFDLPNTVINVKPEQTIPWGLSDDALYEMGIVNMREKYLSHNSLEQLGDITIRFVQGDHFFVPNIVFDLERIPEYLGTHGSLIGIPHRHAVLIYPIEDLNVVKAINQLIPVISGMNQEGPGSVSKGLYWYYNGQLTGLPYSLEEKKLNFYPPEDFLSVLNTLQEPR